MPYSANPEATVKALLAGVLADPFSYLGMHRTGKGLVVRALLPQAKRVRLIDTQGNAKLAELERIGNSGLFLARLQDRMEPFRYRLLVDWGTHEQELEDAYRFGPILGEMDVWLLSEGTHIRPFEKLGAHLAEIDGVAGVSFAVWAPNARRVSVVGDFNGWEGRRHMMRYRHECGVWEMFIPHLVAGDLYKFEIRGADGTVHLKADPFAFRSELRPGTASIVHQMPPVYPASGERRKANDFSAPISIYEVHLGSWRLPFEHGKRWLTYRDLAEQLIPYVKDLGFTHIELLPVNEHPHDGSWGYQPTGLYAPTSRFGTPDDFLHFVRTAHENGLAIILDWVPAHFPSDEHGLARFDGTSLYEHEDPREGVHQEWGSLIYNFGRREVRNYLVGNALYWIERFGIDGLRVDAVASMLYRDYAREPGEWIPNRYGGRENLEAIDFLQSVNKIIGAERPEAITIAEESTSFPKVSRPIWDGGLGFHFKWNLGWMHDTLDYMKLDPLFRKHYLDKIRFGIMYAFSENFMLPLSHDEVVHCKSSILGRMPGDEWQRFANLRAYYGFMWGHPGKKLLFMGGEFAQYAEWDSNGTLDWVLLQYPVHAGVQRLIRDLNTIYRTYPALHQVDFDPRGFQWLVHDDLDNSVFAFLRRDDTGDFVVVISNFTPVPRHGYRVGVPRQGIYREIINTDNTIYGGSGLHNGELQAQPIAMHGYQWSLEVTAPPLATCMLTLKE